ncbi:MAG: ABC transporter substrate-binding protein [Lachnospiraceae bacterium]|nr:ABC transporter substrate-binding protein [Lachnospiraceae bacterium]
MLAVIMLVVLLSGCGARRGAADVSATKSAQIVEETDVSGHAQRYGGDSDKSSSEATVNGLLSFSELSEIPDGSYWIRVSMTGGSGRASISSPTGFYVKDGQATADIHWSSASYDYMKLDGVRYEAFTDAAGHSAMTIPVSALDTAIPVLADTTAMSKPYEIEYELSFDGSALLPMADASMAEAHALPTDELQRAMQSATTQVADAGSSDSAAGNGNSTSAGSNLAAAAGDAQATNVQSGTSTGTAGASGTTDADGRVLWSAAPEIDGLTFVSSEQNDVAEYFRLSSYEDASGAKYQLLETAGGLHCYLIVPAEAQVSGKSSVSAESEVSSRAGTEANHGGKKSAKAGTEAELRFTARASEANSANKEKKGDVLELTVLQQPLTTTYVAASAVMAPLCDIGAVSQIRFSGLREEGWYVDEARAAMKEGTMLFAGKYSEPDYETLLREGCDLALESTMIYRAPEVTEKLNALGIPVYIDYSSYEPHVLGRLEWVRVYGALFGHEEKAQQWYQTERDRILAIQKTAEKSSPTVVYFYVNASGQIQVRQPNDYIPELLELAGARYLAPDMSGLSGSRKSNVTVSLEDFYSSCKDADYLIYSATLDRPLSSIQELLEKNALFADFKAVQEGHVYTTDKDFYQLSDRMADFAEDVSRMLQGQDDMHFLSRVY